MDFDFLDEVVINVKAGKGGDGEIGFRREKYAEFGGPAGGDGGDGGHVVIKATLMKNTLVDFKFKRKFEAENGENGRGKNQYGAKGDDLILEVPVGTVVVDNDKNEIIADLQYPDQYVIVARGGKGGKGNTKFTTSTMQAPRIAEKGVFGEEVNIRLVLKLLADVGIIGFPNVGKSTLISKISNAKPKIANYHFTTLIPNLGVVKVGEGKSFVVADIPGLIEGAHEGIGLGDKFLKHIERCHLLLHIVDIAGSEGRDPIDDYHKIREELFKYSELLSKKTEIIVANKTDLLTEEDLAERIKEFKEKTGKEIIPISAYTGKHTDIVIGKLWQTIEPERMEAIRKIEKMIRDTPEKIKLQIEPLKIEVASRFRIEVVRWDRTVYQVTGYDVELLLQKWDIHESDMRVKILKTLSNNGIEKSLRIAGVQEGDTIYIGDFAFEYIKEYK